MFIAIKSKYVKIYVIKILIRSEPMSEKIIAYHGTVWEKPPIFEEPYISKCSVFKNLKTNMNELNAFYASDQEDICEFFSEEKFGHDHEIFMQAMLKIEIDAERVCRKTFSFGKNILFGNKSFDYGKNEDRIELYSLLREKGYQVFIMESDYTMDDGSKASDIAILDESCFKANSVKLKVKGDWGSYMSYENAKTIYADWTENPENYEDFDKKTYEDENFGFNF